MVCEVFGTEALELKHYALCVFDYGAPTSFRLAAAHPERVSAIISQNGNAYAEGLSTAWSLYQAYWQNPSEATRNACRAALTSEAIRTQYVTGADASRVSPDGYTLDIAYFARPGTDEIQLDLIYDYRTNVALYDAWQGYFRKHKPPMLAVWGEKDIYFLPPAPRRSAATSPIPSCTSSTPATSRSRRTARRSATPCSTSSTARSGLIKVGMDHKSQHQPARRSSAVWRL